MLDVDRLLKRGLPTPSVPRGAFVRLALCAVVGGAAVGGLAWVGSTVLYIAVIFPLAMAYMGSLIISWGVTRGKVRHVLVAGIFGLLIGLVSLATYYQLENMAFRQDVREVLLQQWEGTSRGDDLSNREAEVTRVTDEWLVERTGQSGLLGYLDLTAQQGLRLAWWYGVGDRFVVDFGPRFDRIFVWLYRAIELAAVAGLTLVVAMAAAERPFCALCDEWWEGPRHACPYMEDLDAFIARAKEQAPETVYASVQERLGAFLVDSALFSLPGLLVGPQVVAWLAVLLYFPLGDQPISLILPTALVLTLALLVNWIYCVYSESSDTQGTLGKMLLHVAVTDLHGRPISLARANKRYWVRWLSILPLGLGMWLGAFSPRKQALHDRIACTLVVKAGG